ncbi:hypothetical protein H257_03151 [Aphanomyces astaci]|uniref:RNA helicase n=1 Tax=Aphanomyces astaci TaxID=112090 RepID=W4H1E8_APHAT|nr:hypothetical protein H257_03151 [Aphanomyces astaci]ETV85411.1 hypothetical protein H257_03151 [Aphanomyces astaci]|eukprot:XP_009825429.1 hypothetical protein H257_03151 [Aphanomyces astaci]
MPRSRSRSSSPEPRHRRQRSRSRDRPRGSRCEDDEHRHKQRDDVASTKEEEALPPAVLDADAFQAQRASLPVGQFKQHILDTIASNQIVVCIGETGSGKTTQIPQFLLEAGYATSKRIAITQPRRVATVAVAKRVGEELEASGLSVHAVGYTIRFDDHTSASTKIKFMTDGILVRECLQDPLLSSYSIIMLDEAHERSIHTDILFGLLQSILAKRSDLKLLVTSATLDADKFSAFFHNCPVVQIPGRSFPVDIYHSKQHQIMGKSGPLSTYIQSAVDTTLQIHMHEPDGHILVFLTGQKEIEDACALIRKRLEQLADEQRNSLPHMLVLPLYGALSSDKQRRIFSSCGASRKVIVCTNIAETSLTVDGVKYVVDAGFTKQKVYNPMTGMESLVVLPISQVSAQQRAGRAGRTSAGKCYRLYSKKSYATMFTETIPEIQRSNLANTILYLKVLGIDDVVGFGYLDPPDEHAILDALHQLYTLGALDERGNVTGTGTDMAQFPLEPRLARVLLEAMRLDCADDITRVVAMLTVENVIVPFQGKQRDGPTLERFRHAKGDHLTLLHLFQEWEVQSNRPRWCDDHGLHMRAFQTASNVQKQLQELVDKAIQMSSSTKKQPVDPAVAVEAKTMARLDRVRLAVCAGYFEHGAQKCMMQPVYRVLMPPTHDGHQGAQLVHLHPSSVFLDTSPPHTCVYHELVHTSRAFMRHVLDVQLSWLQLYQPAKPLTLIECYALTNRPVPAPPTPAAALDASHHADGRSKPNKTMTEKTSLDAVAAAKARYLQRKKLQKA